MRLASIYSEMNSTNFSTIQPSQEPPDYPVCDYSLDPIFWVLNGGIGVLILAGNCFTCTVFLRSKALRRKLINVFLLSLAFSDILMAALVIPFYGVFCSGCNYPLSQKCWLFDAGRDIAFLASIFNLFAITYDRYLAVFRPYTYSRKMTKRKVRLMVSTVWVLPLVMAFVRKTWYFFPEHKDKVQTLNKYFTLVLFFTFVVPPILVVSVVNIAIMVVLFRLSGFCTAKAAKCERACDTASWNRELRKTRNAVEMIRYRSRPSLDRSTEWKETTQNTENSKTAPNNENVWKGSMERHEFAHKLRARKGSFSCALVALVFIVSWLPRGFYQVSRLCNRVDLVSPLLVKLSLLFLFLQSAINPFIYSVYKREFRVAAKALLKRTR